MAAVLDDALLDQVLEVAIDASKKAGDIIIGNAGGAEVTERKANSRDLLTLIDPLCEKVCYVTGYVLCVCACLDVLFLMGYRELSVMILHLSVFILTILLKMTFLRLN